MEILQFFAELLQQNYEWLLVAVANVEEFFREHAYQANLVYFSVIAFMYMSSFGLPVPEEVILISAGMVAHVALHPEVYPVPEGPLNPVDPFVLAGVCLFAVISSDYLIYWLGRNFGSRMIEQPRFQKMVRPALIQRVRNWVQRYGAWASALFRFTPGLRFPGHLMCGTMGLSRVKFLLVDGTAAIISVPTQILLLAFYGDKILGGMQKFKYLIIIVLLIVLTYFLIRRYVRKSWV